MGSMNSVDRIDQLIRKGELVLGTHKPNPPNVIGFPTLDSGPFTEWRTQSLACLSSLLGNEHVYVDNFRKTVQQGYRDSVRAGIGILKAVRDDIKAGELEGPEEPRARSQVALLEDLFSRFHLVVRQLRSRHADRQTLDVTDEYDVQDLVHALLWLNFEDVRAEEYTPSYAGKASRVDFLLKQERTVVELKMTRPGLGVKELGSQLIEDIARYKSHPDCQALVCFVYDPSGLIPNPRGIEADLNRDGEPFPVRVLIRP